MTEPDVPDDEQRLAEAFGYRIDPRWTARAVGVSVSEAIHPDTLQPEVIIYLRFLPDQEPVGVALTLPLADHLASEVVRLAAVARSKSLDPDDGG